MFSPQIGQMRWFISCSVALSPLGLHYEMRRSYRDFFHSAAGANSECNWDIFSTYVRYVVQPSIISFLAIAAFIYDLVPKRFHYENAHSAIPLGG